MVIRELITRVGFQVENSKLAAFDRDIGTLRGKLGAMTGNIDAVANKLIGIGGMLTAAVSLPIGLIGVSSLKAASQVEQLDIALSTMLGSQERANKLISDMMAFTERTPFKLEGLQQTVKQLIGMGFEVDTVLDTVENLGNVSSGTGADLQRMALNLAQVKLQGKLTGRDLKDFAAQGVPILAQLAKQLGVTEKEISKMVEGRKITFDDVMEAFRAMSGEGGRFQGLMEKQSKTLGGLWSIFLDKLFRVRIELGKMLVEQLRLDKVLRKVFKVLDVIIKVLTKMPKPLKLILVVMVGLAAVLGPVLIGVGLLIKGFLLLKAVSIITGIAMGTITAQLLIWPAAILAVMAALFLLIDDFKTWQKGGRSVLGMFLDGWKDLVEGIKEIWRGLKGFFKAIIAKDFEEIKRMFDLFKKTNAVFLHDVFGIGADPTAMPAKPRVKLNQLEQDVFNFVKNLTPANRNAFLSSLQGADSAQVAALLATARADQQIAGVRRNVIQMQNEFVVQVPEDTTQNQAKKLTTEAAALMGEEAENVIANNQ